MTAIHSHRVSDGAHLALVAELNNRWRVVLCKDGIQWVLQYRASSSETYAGARWIGRGYFRARNVLIRVCHEKAGDIKSTSISILETLPNRI